MLINLTISNSPGRVIFGWLDEDELSSYETIYEIQLNTCRVSPHCYGGNNACEGFQALLISKGFSYIKFDRVFLFSYHPNYVS